MWSRSANLVGALTGACVFALGGCASGPDFKAPAPPAGAAADGYAMPGDPAAPQARLVAEGPAGLWWRAFGSADLDRLVDEALAGSPTLAEADANLARAQAQRAAARGERGLQIDGNASAQRARVNPQSMGFPGFPAVTTPIYTVGISAAYDLDVFGRLKRGEEAAAARAEAQARRRDAAYLALVGNVVRQAVVLAGLNAEVAAAQAVVDDNTKLVDMARAAVEAGGRPPSEVVGARAQLTEAEAVLPPLIRQRDMARHQLALLVGRSPAEWRAPDLDLSALAEPAEIPVSLPSQLVRRRPDILAAESDLHAATAAIGVAIANQYPDFRLTAGFSQGALEPGTIFDYASSSWSVLGGLTTPLFHSGRLKAERQAAEAEARAAEARYRQTVLRAFVQVADVLAALSADQQQVASLERAVALSETRLKNATTGYRLGGGMMVEVIDAQRQLNTARRELAAARSQRFADMAELYVATAADWRAS